jgi:hypothetical protein
MVIAQVLNFEFRYFKFVCNLVLVIWNFSVEQLVFNQSFFIRSDWTPAASGPADT